MWTERPRPLLDGLLLGTAVSLGLCSILSIWSVDTAKAASTSQCQEVVALVEPRGKILAQCPAGTYIEIVDENVVCRCGSRREPIFDFDDNPPSLIPPPTQPLPNADPPVLKDDKHGIDI